MISFSTEYTSCKWACGCTLRIPGTHWMHPVLSIWPTQPQCRDIWRLCWSMSLSILWRQHQGVQLCFSHLLCTKQPFRMWWNALQCHTLYTTVVGWASTIWLHICRQWRFGWWSPWWSAGRSCLTFLLFQLSRLFTNCALIEWFLPFSNEPDTLTGMWIVVPEVNAAGHRVRAVISVKSILQGVHLIGVFGAAFLPITLHFSHSFNTFNACYVNRYIDHHLYTIC